MLSSRWSSLIFHMTEALGLVACQSGTQSLQGMTTPTCLCMDSYQLLGTSSHIYVWTSKKADLLNHTKWCLAQWHARADVDVTLYRCLCMCVFVSGCYACMLHVYVLCTLYAWVCVCMCVCSCVCVCMCVCVCVNVCVWMWLCCESWHLEFCKQAIAAVLDKRKECSWWGECVCGNVLDNTRSQLH